MWHAAHIWITLLSILCCSRPVHLFSTVRDPPFDSGSDAAAQLKTCLSTAKCLQYGSATKWTDFLSDKPPCLAVHRIWWSPRTPRMPAVLVTQLSADRVAQLASQCVTWRGPLAAALHIALPREVGQLSEASRRVLAGAELRIDAMYQAAEAAGNCQLRVMLVYEFLAEHKAVSLYPVNSLRNYARLMADAELIANIDVDMVPSLSLSLSLMEESTGKMYLEGCRAGHVYVLPAFDVNCGGPAYADAACLKHKTALVQLLQADCVMPFRAVVAPASHNVTDFAAWVTAKAPYGITYQELFEPWFLSARARTPWFDSRFRGYGKNKIVQAMHMNWTGSNFQVHSSAFVIHRPHNESRARKEFMRAKFGRSKAAIRMVNGSIYEHIGQLYAATKVELEQAVYHTHADPGMDRCLQNLPWWRNLVIKLGSDR